MNLVTKVLIADGDQEFCARLKDMIGGIPGYDVTAVAQDGKTAVELLNKHHPDVMVLDLMLPEMDGLAVLKAGKSMEKQPSALVLTGFMTDFVSYMAADLGV